MNVYQIHFAMLPEQAFRRLGKKLLSLEGKGSAPPPPDYAGAAQATAAGNLDAARAAAAANRVNQVTPYGNLTYNINGKDSFGNDMYTATQTLSPDQQALLNQTTALNKDLMGTAGSGLTYARDVLQRPGVDTSTLPALRSDVPTTDFQKTLANSGPGFVSSIQDTGPGYATSVQANGPGYAKTIDSLGLGNRAEKAVYDEHAAMLDPQWRQAEEELRTRLSNQGLMIGSEGYNRAMGDFSRQKDYAYKQARNAAIQKGMEYQGQLFGQGLSNAGLQNAEQQGLFSQGLTNANLRNAAQQGLFSQGLSAANLQNAVQQNAFGQDLSAANLYNTAQNQLFAQGLSGANLSNAARQQGFQESAYNQMQPINVINAIRSGTQVSNPNFVNVPQQATTAGADMLGAAQLTGQYNSGNYAAQTAADSQVIGALLGAGARIFPYI